MRGRLLDGVSDVTHRQFYEDISVPYTLERAELDEKSPQVRTHSPS